MSGKIKDKSNSSYRKFLQERENVLNHKEIISKKNKEDIEFEYALVDWAINKKENLEK